MPQGRRPPRDGRADPIGRPAGHARDGPSHRLRRASRRPQARGRMPSLLRALSSLAIAVSVLACAAPGAPPTPPPAASASAGDPSTAPVKPVTETFFGATVTYATPEGDEQTVRIVGIDEMDPSRHYVSWISPVARALIKAREGDTVSLKTPAGSQDKKRTARLVLHGNE